MLLITASCIREEPETTPTPIPPAKSTPTPSTDISPAATTNKPVFADITDFESGENAYEYGFANYREDNESDYLLNAQILDIPDSSSKGYYMSGSNQSRSLLMYITKNIIALPNANYNIKINFDIATNIKSDISEQSNTNQNVFIKAGAAGIPFSPIIDNEGYYRSNWDIGNLNSSGPDGKTLGTAEKVNSNDDSYQYKSYSGIFRAATDDDGILCILIAAETGMPSVASLFFDNIVLEITEE